MRKDTNRPLFHAFFAAAVLSLTLPSFAAEFVLIDEDFETDLGDWNTRTRTYSGAVEEDEIQTTIATSGSDFNGPNTGYPGSQAVGYSFSELNGGTAGRYLTLKFPGAVGPGTYYVELEGDFYVYRHPSQTDPWGVGSFMLILTDEAYDNPHYSWDNNIRGDYFLSGPMNQQQGHMLRLWPGRPYTDHTTDWSGNGTWQHIHIMDDGTVEVNSLNVTGNLPSSYPCSVSGGSSDRRVCNKIFTESGDLEIRLLFWDKGGREQAVAWDNLSVTLRDQSDTILWTFSEDFEGADPLEAGWEAGLYPPYNDKPDLFEPNDPRLLGDANSNGSRSGGYADDIPHPTAVQYAWMVQQLPAVVQPGSYTVRITMDRYVKKGTSFTSDPYRVGNRFYFLYDNLYDNDAWNPDTDLPDQGIASSLWPGDSGDDDPPFVSGVWQQLEIEEDFITSTGNVEVRLLLHDKYGDPQAVAWDKIRVSLVTPCNAPRFDYDGDLDVDQDDFAVFQLCVTDSNVTEECRCANVDQNDSIDQTDFQAFEACASGPAIPADLDCDADLPFP